MKPDNILVGDIGGTKTLLAITKRNGGEIELLHEKSFQSSQYPNLEAIVSEYLSDLNMVIDKACFAIAGPIKNMVAKVTNLPWEVDAKLIETKFNFKTADIINDLEAIANAIPILGKDDVHTIHKGKPVEKGPIAVVAPGTGLGEAYLTFDNGQYFAHPSEGSHASFSPINDMQMKLLKYLQTNGLDHVSIERVCSGGIGIPNIYQFAKTMTKESEPDWFKDKLNNSDDITPIIIKTAQSSPEKCPTCKLTLDLFCEILAVEAGNLALKILSTGGIYLAGGISAKIIDQLKKPAFVETLQKKGRFNKLLKQIPIRVITNQKTGLLGAAQYLITKID